MSLFETEVGINELPELIKDIHNKRPLFHAIGQCVQEKAQANARRKGGSSFWDGIARSVSFYYDDETLIVGSVHRVSAHKQFGGIISAPGKSPESRKSKYLTIPIANEARGKNASDFKKLFMFISKKGNRILAQNLDGELRPLFVLKKSVTQKASPWFPTGMQLDYAIKKGVDQFMCYE